MISFIFMAMVYSAVILLVFQLGQLDERKQVIRRSQMANDIRYALLDEGYTLGVHSHDALRLYVGGVRRMPVRLIYQHMGSGREVEKNTTEIRAIIKNRSNNGG